MTHRRPRPLAPIAAALVVLLTVTGTALASDRTAAGPVNDPSRLIVIQIRVIDLVVKVVDARLDRIIGALPPGPPTMPVGDALAAVRGSFGALLGTVNSQLCQDGTIGSGDTARANSDVQAADTSPTGVVAQLDVIGLVTNELNAQMTRIGGAIPPGPPVRAVHDALAQLETDTAAGFEAITARLGDSVHPPSPCVTT